MKPSAFICGQCTCSLLLASSDLGYCHVWPAFFIQVWPWATHAYGAHQNRSDLFLLAMGVLQPGCSWHNKIYAIHIYDAPGHVTEVSTKNRNSAQTGNVLWDRRNSEEGILLDRFVKHHSAYIVYTNAFCCGRHRRYIAPMAAYPNFYNRDS